MDIHHKHTYTLYIAGQQSQTWQRIKFWRYIHIESIFNKFPTKIKQEYYIRLDKTSMHWECLLWVLPRNNNWFSTDDNSEMNWQADIALQTHYLNCFIPSRTCNLFRASIVPSTLFSTTGLCNFAWKRDLEFLISYGKTPESKNGTEQRTKMAQDSNSKPHKYIPLKLMHLKYATGNFKHSNVKTWYRKPMERHHGDRKSAAVWNHGFICY